MHDDHDNDGIDDIIIIITIIIIIIIITTTTITITITTQLSGFIVKNLIVTQSRNFPPFMEPEGS